MVDLIDGTGHIRVRFDPGKYEKYKDILRVGQKVIVHGRVVQDIKMLFCDFIVILDESKIKKELEKNENNSARKA